MGFKKSLCEGLELRFQLVLRLTPRQYGKTFGLSATHVAYYPLVSIPYYIAIDSPLYLNISKIGLSSN